MAINISFDWILDKLTIRERATTATHFQTGLSFQTVGPRHIQSQPQQVRRSPSTFANIASVRLAQTPTLIAASNASVLPFQTTRTIIASNGDKDKWMPIQLKSLTFPNELTSEQNECSWYLELTSYGSDVALKLCLAQAEESNYYFSDIDMNLCTNDKAILVNRSCKSIFHLKHHNEYSFENFTRKQALKFFQGDESKKPLKISCKISIQVEKCVFHKAPQEIPDFEKLLNDPEFSDFIIATSGKEFKVHKIILTARSEVFSTMIKNEMREKIEGILKITDFDDEVFEEFLRYIYCGRVQYLDRLAEELLRAADKYSIDSLKSVCLEEICKKLCAENALELLSLVDYHKVDYLKAIILNFVVINIKKFAEPQFQLLANSKLSNEILLKVVKLIT